MADVVGDARGGFAAGGGVEGGSFGEGEGGWGVEERVLRRACFWPDEQAGFHLFERINRGHA